MHQLSLTFYLYTCEVVNICTHKYRHFFIVPLKFTHNIQRTHKAKHIQKQTLTHIITYYVHINNKLNVK